MKTLLVDDFVSGIKKITECIIENEVYFCELDSHAGDGDFGMSLAKGFKIIRDEWETLERTDIGTFLKSCGMIIYENCGGASGPIWGSGFNAAARYAKGKRELSFAELSEMLQASIDKIQKLGGAKLGDKTLLDTFIPAVESLKQSAAENKELPGLISDLVKAAEQGAENTKSIAAVKGRASYVGERSIGFPDAGALALSIIIKVAAGPVPVI